MKWQWLGSFFLMSIVHQHYTSLSWSTSFFVTEKHKFERFTNFDCPWPIVAESSWFWALDIPSSYYFVNYMFLNHQVQPKYYNHLLVFNNKNVMLITLYLIALNTWIVLLDLDMRYWNILLLLLFNSGASVLTLKTLIRLINFQLLIIHFNTIHWYMCMEENL